MTIYSKTENGFEIQDSCCGVSGIMMRLKVFKEETDYSSIDIDEETMFLLYGVRVLNEFIGSFVLIEEGSVDMVFLYNTYVEKLNKYYIFRVLRSLVGRIRN